MKCDELQRHSIRGVMYNGEEICGGFSYYDADEVDAAIAELKDKCQMHDFFWDGCGFAKRGFKNAIAVSEAFDKLDAENAELKKKCEAEKSIGATFSKNGADLARWVEELRKEIESLKASRYAESVDAGMRERRLKRALYNACANWACTKMEYEQFGSNVYMLGVATEKEVSWESMMKKCQAKAEEYR